MSLNTEASARLTLAKGATIGDVRSAWLLPTLFGLSAITLVAVVYLTAYKNFYYDEWDWISAYRPSQSTSILFPNAEHWSTIPVLLWKGLFATAGLRTHVPYEVLAVAAHVACVFAMFALVRRYSGVLPAFGAALALLVLGSGAHVFLFAFQVGWTLSIAFGLLAMLLAGSDESPKGNWRLAGISALLLASLMSSGVGLGLLVAVTVQLLLDRTGRRMLIAVVLPFGAYLAWFVIYGAGLPGTPGSRCASCPTALGTDFQRVDPGYVASVANFIRVEFLATTSGLLGLTGHNVPVLLIQIVFAGLIGLLAWHWYAQGGIANWEVALLCGLLAQFTLVALIRVRFGTLSGTNSRYVYVGVVYLLPLVANAVKHLSWRWMWRPVWMSAFAAILFSNAALLVDQATAQRQLMTTLNEQLRVVELFRGAPDMALDTPLDDLIMPQLTARRYYAAIDELGSPVPATTAIALDAMPPTVVDRQTLALFEHSLAIIPDRERKITSSCFTLRSAAAPSVDIQVPDGQALVLTASQDSESLLYLSLFGPSPSKPSVQAKLGAGTPQWVHVPNTGKPLTWRLRIVSSPVGELQVCGGNNLRVLPS